MTGQKLFRMYVQAGLCSSMVYEWDKLSLAMQTRWNMLAAKLELKGK